MKQRVTYFVPKRTEIGQINTGIDSLRYNGDAAVEKVLTLRLDELPTELRTALVEIGEIHLKWVSRWNHANSPSILARLVPGLHVFTPQPANVCPLLKTMFGPLKCNTPEIDSQAYWYLPKIVPFQTWLARTFCASTKGQCVEEIAALTQAGYIDIDLTHDKLRLAAYWPTPTSNHLVTKYGERCEVGVLQEEESNDPQKTKLGGYLTVLGEDKKPKGTLFSFPSRHFTHPNGTYTVSFNHPTGLHPELSIFLNTHQMKCPLYTYLTLPTFLFLDQYSFSDPLVLSSQGLDSLINLKGETNLEAPDWAVQNSWGSAALFKLNPQSNHITIKTHLRYLQANSTDSESGYKTIDIPWPIVFYSCPANGSLENPFDRVNLGYDGILGDGVFYHLTPEGTELVERVRVPVLEDKPWVGIVTFLLVLVGFAIVVLPLLMKRLGWRGGRRKVE
ncbi:PIG-X-domain-containing protein [Piedraia hortae CBS 480.64]|uniref:Protein PBN1 n=1 Tax=Piedraia hortae CBS 480.64 TaxID=1314780 RepID=A0A6A7BSX9_9PEZI|nr:PIG-X-domain-containing protein [Piedraia hortae CBS 480.64]